MGKRSGEGNGMMGNKSRDQKSECSSNNMMIVKSDPKEKDIMVNLVMSIFSLIDHKLFLQADI